MIFPFFETCSGLPWDNAVIFQHDPPTLDLNEGDVEQDMNLSMDIL